MDINFGKESNIICFRDLFVICYFYYKNDILYLVTKICFFFLEVEWLFGFIIFIVNLVIYYMYRGL